MITNTVHTGKQLVIFSAVFDLFYYRGAYNNFGKQFVMDSFVI